MSTQARPLSQLQLFVMKRERLEQSIVKFYADSQDADTVIQYVVAVLVRHSLCISDFSLICKELIREILLFAEPSDALRKFAPLFRDFFDSGREWEQACRRLYKNTKEYHRYNNRVSHCKKYLFEKTTPLEALNGQQYKLASTFEDAVGKIHTWSLRDADKYSSAMKIDAVLELLSSLTIFEKDGVRRFVKLENSEIVNCTRHIKIRKGEIVEESAQNKPEPTTGFDFSTMSEEEKLELVKQLLPEGIELTATGMNEAKDGTLEESSDNNEADAPSLSIATAQEAAPTSGTVTTADKEPPTISEKPATSDKTAKKNPQSIYKKPKSEKQKAIEEKERLLKQKNKGQSNSKSGNRKERKRRRRK